MATVSLMNKALIISGISNSKRIASTFSLKNQLKLTKPNLNAGNLIIYATKHLCNTAIS